MTLESGDLVEKGTSNVRALFFILKKSDYYLIRFVKAASQIDRDTLYIIGRKIIRVLIPVIKNVDG